MDIGLEEIGEAGLEEIGGAFDDVAERHAGRSRQRAVRHRVRLGVVHPSPTPCLATRGSQRVDRRPRPRAPARGAPPRTVSRAGRDTVTVDRALRRRARARLAIYGPPITGLIGMLLWLSGVYGVTRNEMSETSPMTPRPPSSAAMTARAEAR